MREFWVSSGHHLTHRTADGELAVTDELILAFLARRELVPPHDACPAEQALHAALLQAPRRPVDTRQVNIIADPDARENWRFMLAFRARLLDAPTVEAAYRRLVRDGAAGIPPLFMCHLTHLVLRNALEGCADPYVLRAAELFFRSQRAAVQDGALLLADAEIVERHETASALSPLAIMLDKAPEFALDVMDDSNAWTYWSRSDAFTMALNLSNERSRLGLARVIEVWTRHLLHIQISVAPVARIEDEDWHWFVGLDRQATAIGNAMWHGRPIDEKLLAQIVALFRLDIASGYEAEPGLAGHPVYLISALEADNVLRMKPQNLIVGLPVTSRSVVA